MNYWHCAFIVLFLPSVVHALEAENVFLLVNKNVPDSGRLAEHYCKQRKVPKANVIVLDLPDSENISRADFDNRLRKPLRKALKQRQK